MTSASVSCPDHRTGPYECDEKIVGTFDLPASKDWKEVKLPFETALTGVQNIKLIVDEAKDLDVDWISFE